MVLPGVHAVIQVRPASELCPVLIVANLRWSHPTFMKIKKPSAFRWGEGIDIFLNILNKHLLRFASREISSSESCSDFSSRQKKIKKDSRSQKKGRYVRIVLSVRCPRSRTSSPCPRRYRDLCFLLAKRNLRIRGGQTVTFCKPSSRAGHKPAASFVHPALLGSATK